MDFNTIKPYETLIREYLGFYYILQFNLLLY